MRLFQNLLKKLLPHVDSGPGVTTTLGKRKRFTTKLILGLLAFSGIFLFFMTRTSPPAKKPAQVKGKPIDIRPMVEQIDVDRETWILQSSQRMKRMENELSVLKEQVLKLQNQAQNLQASQQTLEKTVMKLPFKMDSIANAYTLKSPPAQKSGAFSQRTTQPTVQGALAQPTLVPATTRLNQGNRIRVYNTAYAEAASSTSSESLGALGSHPSGETSSPKAPTHASSPKSQIRTLSASVPGQDTLSYYTIPSGSFAQGVILSGAYAPSLTGGESKGAGPYPVLIEIVDPYIMPSLRRGGLKHAFVIASAYGDLSSERAILRLERISFIYKDGSTLDQPVKGWVVGPDGMYGIHGKVVSREGALIARAMLAGMLSGVSGALEQAGRVVQQTPLGVTSYIPPKNVGKTAAYSGLGKAAEMLANFYIQRANQLFPVVEVPAGTDVTLVLLEPLKVKLLDTSIRRSLSWE